MVTEGQIRDSLEEVIVPGAKRSLGKLNLVRQVAISERRLSIELASAALNQDTQEWIRARIREVVTRLSGIDDVEIGFVDAACKDINAISNVIAIMSGKGGVGKSLVTGLIGISLARKGYEVGILDGDITGPSIPRMFGVVGRPAGSDNGILPILSRAGIGIMSINLLLEREDDAVIWRGPLIGKAITQFWQDVLWGKLDYLLVDLPPGTADAPLTVMQSLPLTGVIIVFSPQELATMVVRKAIRMAQDAMHIPILGVVENMGYLILPDTGKRMDLFGRSKGEEMAQAAGAPLLGQIPLDPEIAKLCDAGEIDHYDSEVMEGIAGTLVHALSATAK